MRITMKLYVEWWDDRQGREILLAIAKLDGNGRYSIVPETIKLEEGYEGTMEVRGADVGECGFMFTLDVESPHFNIAGYEDVAWLDSWDHPFLFDVGNIVRLKEQSVLSPKGPFGTNQLVEDPF